MKPLTKDDLFEEYDEYDDPCNYIDEDEFENYYHPLKEDTRLNHIKGKATHMYARYKLKDEGYDVVDTIKTSLEGKCSLNEELITKHILSKYEGDGSKLISLLNNGLAGLPDIIGIKEGVISFFEVKANDSKLSDNQKEKIEFLKKNGFLCSVLRFDVDLDIKEK